VKKIIVKILITFMIFVLLVWSSKTTHTSAHVLIKEVSSNEIVIEWSEGEFTMTIDSTLQNLIEEDREYFIKYKETRWGKPKLKYIEPI
jgi:hypothetical protein